LPLSARFRFALYAAFATLFVTGAAWLIADALKDGDDAETWQIIAANLLMLHGGAAMLALMLLGALVPLHVQRAWLTRKNRTTGTAMLSFNAVFVATSFGLYYAGAEGFRPWISGVHIAIGFGFPLLFFVHVLLGRRQSARQAGNPRRIRGADGGQASGDRQQRTPGVQVRRW